MGPTSEIGKTAAVLAQRVLDQVSGSPDVEVWATGWKGIFRALQVGGFGCGGGGLVGRGGGSGCSSPDVDAVMPPPPSMLHALMP